jgi:aminoglycoside phosphotransferase (APT) family kinase protein
VTSISRPLEELRVSGAFRRWITERVGGNPGDPLDIELISGGHSNLTFGLRVGARDLVLRRPPIGAFLPSANDMAREYTFLSALASSPVPTPGTVGLCEDPEVIGAPFYVMERLHGVVPHDPSVLEGLGVDAGRRLSENVVEVLVALHDVDVDAVGLGQIAKRSGYLDRQVRRWVGQYERSKDDGDAPVIEELAALLRTSIPTSPDSTIVHGDYRLGNLMVDATDRSRVIGVFDWEMATLGDPLADVGYTLLYWGTQDRPPVHPSQRCADLPGFLSAAELVQRYADRSGRAVDHITFYVVLAAFKLVIIGLGQRAVRRRAGETIEGSAAVSLPLAEWALELGRSQLR